MENHLHIKIELKTIALQSFEKILCIYVLLVRDILLWLYQ